MSDIRDRKWPHPDTPVASAQFPPLRRTRLQVTGMDCASCAAKVDRALRQLPAVRDTSVSVAVGTVLVEHEDGLDRDVMATRIEALGYKVAPLEPPPVIDAARGEHAAGPASGGAEAHVHSHEHAGDGPWWRTPKAQLTLACGAALTAAYAVGYFVPSIGPVLFVTALAVGLVPIAWRALSAARFGSPFTIEMLMTIAAVGAVVIGATTEAGVVVFLFLVGEMLENVAAGRARASITALVNLVPKTAFVERGEDGRVEEISADKLAVDNVVLVRPGDRIPADGTILSGSGGVDEAPVTGESVPKHKQAGDGVFAGTINLEAALRVRVTAAAEDNTIARVVRLVEEAQESKAPTERFIDRFSKYYTPGVLVLGLLFAVVPPLAFGGDWLEWIYKGLAILLIGCPCALVISTPAAIAAGLAAGARRGLLMKGGAILEKVGRVTVVALDKTGTLTAGKPVTTDVVAIGRTEQEVIAVAAALETGSSHPLAKAILSRAAASGIKVPAADDVRNVSGKGVSGRVGGADVLLGSAAAAAERTTINEEVAVRVASLADEGKTVSILVVDNAVAGLIAMRDEPRADAADGLDALGRLGIRAVMLTGDNRRSGEAIARGLGIEARTELLPQDKQRIVAELKADGSVVAKVGDGINDAPALAAADVGIAMGGGTDVALETADAASLHARVADIAAMVRLSRTTMANIRQNIFISLGLKVVFLVTTAIGVTGLWPAILADTGATVLVTANAMRLLRARFS